MQRRLLLAISLPVLALAGCQTTPARVRADAAHDTEMFDPIKALVGEWEVIAGDETDTTHFAMTAGDSAVCETMFPGSQFRMTNLYHMDGRNLVITHYCAAGNQPRMVANHAEHTDAGLVYTFGLDSVSNLRAEHEHYMGNMTLTIGNDGTLRQDWRSYDRDGSLGEPMSFILRRRN